MDVNHGIDIFSGVNGYGATCPPYKADDCDDVCKVTDTHGCPICDCSQHCKEREREREIEREREREREVPIIVNCNLHPCKKPIHVCRQFKVDISFIKQKLLNNVFNRSVFVSNIHRYSFDRKSAICMTS